MKFHARFKIAVRLLEYSLGTDHAGVIRAGVGVGLNGEKPATDRNWNIVLMALSRTGEVGEPLVASSDEPENSSLKVRLQAWIVRNDRCLRTPPKSPFMSTKGSTVKTGTTGRSLTFSHQTLRQADFPKDAAL
jgi:hypothetical protein